MTEKNKAAAAAGNMIKKAYRVGVIAVACDRIWALAQKLWGWTLEMCRGLAEGFNDDPGNFPGPDLILA